MGPLQRNQKGQHLTRNKKGRGGGGGGGGGGGTLVE